MFWEAWFLLRLNQLDTQRVAPRYLYLDDFERSWLKSELVRYGADRWYAVVLGSLFIPPLFHRWATGALQVTSLSLDLSANPIPDRVKAQSASHYLVVSR